MKQIFGTRVVIKARSGCLSESQGHPKLYIRAPTPPIRACLCGGRGPGVNSHRPRPRLVADNTLAFLEAKLELSPGRLRKLLVGRRHCSATASRQNLDPTLRFSCEALALGDDKAKPHGLVVALPASLAYSTLPETLANAIF